MDGKPTGASLSETLPEIASVGHGDGVLPCFTLNLPKIERKGEDADPVLTRFSEGVWVSAVFDGMGGRGARRYTDRSTGEEHSGGYFASRLVRDSVLDYFGSCLGTDPDGDPSCPPSADDASFSPEGCLASEPIRDAEEEDHDRVSGLEVPGEGFADGHLASVGDLAPASRLDAQRPSPNPESLKQWIHQHLMEFRVDRLDAPDSRLRGGLISELPTTLSCALIIPFNGGAAVETWNVGDSRAYLLGPDLGLAALTKDDTLSGDDALESLRTDPPLSQFIALDRDYSIIVRIKRVFSPCLIFTSTDGCFGYVRSPMDFEHMLLESLDQAESFADWRAGLRSRLRDVAADDCSLSMAALGFSGFDEIRARYQGRLNVLRERFIVPLDEAERMFNMKRLEARETAEKDFAEAEREFRASIRSLWQIYQGESGTHSG